jgi:TolA-binding protein
MKGRNRNIKSNTGELPENNSWNDTYHDLMPDNADSLLFDYFGKYMRGRLDLEEVKNDPSLPGVDKVVKEMISEYHASSVKRPEDVKFIRDSFTGMNHEKKILNEIEQIRLEAGNTNINEISAGWVKEWHEKRQKIAGKDPATNEIRNFITNSLESEKREPETEKQLNEVKGFTRSQIIRYISLSAAAVIGVFVLISTLLPSSDPGKLFNLFYQPFDIISPITRSVTASEPEIYSSAIESYRLGYYQSAAMGFSDAILKDTTSITPRFFMGVTQMAMGNFGEAVNLLRAIAVSSGEYRKEAGWYLGLAYLKTGEKEKAAECFALLAQSPGFYSERAETILRRLK